ncbi:PHP domain-containing protein [Phormidium sp. LEGE 05292]|uniref:PHP domain-containing protein n=1 Tax=[Phormidium] sp. LEGE 05292 TaxID=767427 RepID=UPI00187DF75E|nr:PHP domain-containing protein [Phormidium sp. LEGE 05292]MBE9228724.1 PHP domain-containing protein [Phormidium sp. LEGE 05292]
MTAICNPLGNQFLDSAQLLAAQDVVALKEVFQTISAESCPLHFNFHLHTKCSDGKLEPQQLVEQAIAIGLKGFAITDHHSVNGFYQATNWLEQWKHSHPETSAPRLWTGVEITAKLLGTEVHILGYGFNPRHPSMLTYLLGVSPIDKEAKAANAIAAIHQAGGLAVLAHPARYRQAATALIPEAAHLGIDGVETYYAYNNPNPWCTSPEQTKQVQQLSATYNLLNTCGTDTHGLSILLRL